jgi:diphthine-ammonia ligase
MKVAVLYSGGKDSCASLHWARLGGHAIDCLVGVVPESRDSFMYHVPGTEIMDLFSEALGTSLVKVAAPQKDEIRPLKKALGELDIEGVVTGAVRSEFQKIRIDRICGQLGLEHLAPFWHSDPEKHIRDILAAGFEVIFTGVAAEGLGEGWLGRRFDAGALDELRGLRDKYGINIEGEGGEYETLAIFGPTHKKRIVLDEFSREWRRDSGRIHITKAHLE